LASIIHLILYHKPADVRNAVTVLEREVVLANI